MSRVAWIIVFVVVGAIFIPLALVALRITWWLWLPIIVVVLIGAAIGWLRERHSHA